MKILGVNSICKAFEQEQVLKNVSIELNKGELVSILGVSGAGKTTLFNIISGLVMPDSGNIMLEDEDITGKSGRVSYMLQKDMLLPHKTVIDNVSLPLVVRGMKKKNARGEASGYFDAFGIQGTQNKYPSQLSGGMRQRAALLRTYLFSDRVVLLDEPFSALDMFTRRNLQQWYLDIAERLCLSTLFVTHDVDEAIMLSDKIYIMTGKPGTISGIIVIDRPRNNREGFEFTKEFLEYKKLIVQGLSDT